LATWAGKITAYRRSDKMLLCSEFDKTKKTPKAVVREPGILKIS